MAVAVLHRHPGITIALPGFCAYVDQAGPATRGRAWPLTPPAVRTTVRIPDLTHHVGPGGRMYFHNPLSTISPALDDGGSDTARTVHDAPDPDAGPGLRVWVFHDGAGNVLLTLRGEVDGHTAALLDALLPATLGDSSAHRASRTVTLDFADITFVDQRSITDLQRLFRDLIKAGWKVSLANARPNVADLLAIARHHQAPTPTGPPVIHAPKAGASQTPLLGATTVGII